MSTSATFPCIAKTEQALHAKPLPLQVCFSAVHGHAANPLLHFQLHFSLAVVDFTALRGEASAPLAGSVEEVLLLEAGA
jgi:hypothetical protein